MFRVIVRYTTTPTFWMVCDDRACGITAASQALIQSQETMNKSQGEFMQSLAKDGWAVALDAQFCPQCAAMMRAKMAEEQQKRIQVVSGQAIKNGKLVQLK
jgi:hypothetical protein